MPPSSDAGLRALGRRFVNGAVEEISAHALLMGSPIYEAALYVLESPTGHSARENYESNRANLIAFYRGYAGTMRAIGHKFRKLLGARREAADGDARARMPEAVRNLHAPESRPSFDEGAELAHRIFQRLLANYRVSYDRRNVNPDAFATALAGYMAEVMRLESAARAGLRIAEVQPPALTEDSVFGTVAGLLDSYWADVLTATVEIAGRSPIVGTLFVGPTYKATIDNIVAAGSDAVLRGTPPLQA